ncbi:MAG: DUF1415 family protein [Snodgrassella sp.]|nr:DUF1415 family protein [Snodgrassella sp.]
MLLFLPSILFADTAANISQYANHSPYLTLHSICKSSIDQAVAKFPESEYIYKRNIALLQQMGLDRWNKRDTLYSNHRRP